MSAWRLRGPELSDAPVVNWSSRLEGVIYRFRLSYRSRYDCWDLTVATASGVVVIDGIRATEGFPMLAAWSDKRLPPGTLTCVDSLGLGAHPTRNDWKERHYIRYDDFVAAVVDNELSIQPPEVPPG